MKSTDWPASSAERGMAADRTEAVRCVPRPEYGVRPQGGSGPLYGGDEAARRADLRGSSAAVRQRREERTELMAWFGKKSEEREIQGSDPFLVGRTEAAKEKPSKLVVRHEGRDVVANVEDILLMSDDVGWRLANGAETEEVPQGAQEIPEREYLEERRPRR